MFPAILKTGARTARGRLISAGIAGILLLASLVMSLTYIPGSRTPTIMWLALAAVAVVFIRMAFADVWNYLFWLLLVYVFGFVGAITLTQLPVIYPNIRLWLYLVGVFLELMSLALCFYMLLHIKGIRDEIAGIADKSAASARLREDAFERGDYIPLGLWSLAMVGFYVLTNTSALGLVRWIGAPDEKSLVFYTGSEVLLVGLTLYILWSLQTRFQWGERAEILPALTSIVRPRLGPGRKGVKAPTSCPSCKSPITVEERMCRSCGRPRDMYWCSKSEHYLIQCANCRRYTVFGREKCIHCDRKLPNKMACACGAKHPPRKWPRASH